MGTRARPEESLSPRFWACSQLDLSRGQAILGTGLCPKAKVSKLQFSSWEGGDGGARGEQDWTNGKGAGRKGERISHGERGEMGG